MEPTKLKHGGKRPGSGRKPDQVKKATLTFRVLPQFKDLIKKTFKEILKETEKF
jgi:hypothetical protein